MGLIGNLGSAAAGVVGDLLYSNFGDKEESKSTPQTEASSVPPTSVTSKPVVERIQAENAVRVVPESAINLPSEAEKPFRPHFAASSLPQIQGAASSLATVPVGKAVRAAQNAWIAGKVSALPKMADLVRQVQAQNRKTQKALAYLNDPLPPHPGYAAPAPPSQARSKRRRRRRSKKAATSQGQLTDELQQALALSRKLAKSAKRKRARQRKRARKAQQKPARA